MNSISLIAHETLFFTGWNLEKIRNSDLKKMWKCDNMFTKFLSLLGGR